MVELYRYRDLIWALVMRELKVRYRRSVIGLMWTMLQPLLTMAVMHFVFSTIFRFDIWNYPVYVLSGILFWNFFSQSITVSMTSLRGNKPILEKLPVPRAAFPIAAVISGVINLLLALVPLIAILLLTRHPMDASLLFLPVSILIATIFTLGAGLLLAPLAVFFSDIVELVGVILTLGFYATPVFYPKEIAAQHAFYWIIRYNPVRSIMEVFRDPIYLHKIPPVTHLSVAMLLSVGILILGAYVFNRASDRIPFYL